jgi:hypothetical protein
MDSAVLVNRGCGLVELSKSPCFCRVCEVFDVVCSGERVVVEVNVEVSAAELYEIVLCVEDSGESDGRVACGVLSSDVDWVGEFSSDAVGAAAARSTATSAAPEIRTGAGK